MIHVLYDACHYSTPVCVYCTWASASGFLAWCLALEDHSDPTSSLAKKRLKWSRLTDWLTDARMILVDGSADVPLVCAVHTVHEFSSAEILSAGIHRTIHASKEGRKVTATLVPSNMETGSNSSLGSVQYSPKGVSSECLLLRSSHGNTPPEWANPLRLWLNAQDLLLHFPPPKVLIPQLHWLRYIHFVLYRVIRKCNTTGIAPACGNVHWQHCRAIRRQFLVEHCISRAIPTISCMI